MRISLNGSDWLFKDFYGEDWRWRDAHAPDTRDVRWWRHGGCVPGSVLDDLWRLGEIANPYFERNSLLCEWVPQRTWVYKKLFHAPGALGGVQKPGFCEKPGFWTHARLVFEGVDYEAEFFLNGEPLGAHCGMYTPAEFEVGDRLRYGTENLLAVVIAAAPHEEPQVGRTSRVHTHKARMNYWWDFCPRLVHQGIWDDVYLEFPGPVHIADLFVRPRLSDDFTRAEVEVDAEIEAKAGAEVEAEVVLRFDGQIVAGASRNVRATAGRTPVRVTLPVDRPHLWWPNGCGEQVLYECEVTASPPWLPSPELPVQERGARGVKFGIRRIELAANDTPDTTARPYTFVVNGRKVYIKGWNWVPMDALYGVPRPEKLERLLTLAQAAHVNLLRVWGGGLIEREAFYNLCDRLGIMVWQEFALSSSGIDNSPSAALNTIAMLTAEAEQIIPRRRNHPSLALWCGGNELQGHPGMASAPDVARGAELPLDDSHPALAALKAVVARLDPDRLWLPTSPTGRAFGNSLENIERDPLGQHDVHGPWEYQGVTKHYTLYNAGTSLFHSEFGVEGITNPRSLDAAIAPEHQWPVDLAQNPYWFHLGAWWVRRVVWDETFGPLPDVASYVRATQFIQADGLRYAVEADRRRKWRNSGTIPWQFNEPYPMAACTSAVDYWGEPKPAYYAVARAYEPITVTAAYPTIAWGGRELFGADVWTSAADPNADPKGLLRPLGSAGSLHTCLIGASGRLYAERTHPATFAINAATRLANLQYPINDLTEDIFFLDLLLAGDSGDELARNRYVFTRTDLAALVAPQPVTTLAVETWHPGAKGDDWAVAVANTGPHTAFFVWLEACPEPGRRACPEPDRNQVSSRNLVSHPGSRRSDVRAPGEGGWAAFDDNYFCLLPGERRTVTVTWQGAAESERALAIRGWNTERTLLSAWGDA